jgi:SAM-dependent methyltransferase
MKVKQKKETKVSEPKKIAIDLACGDRKIDAQSLSMSLQMQIDEVIGVDSEKTDSIDIQANILEFPWKFAKDNSIDALYTAHFVEHIPMIYWNEGNKLTVLPQKGSIEMFEKFFEECHRILKPGGKMRIICPYYSSIRCWQDPTHRRAISESSFLYLKKEWREFNKLEHCHGKSNFDFVYGHHVAPHINGRNPEFRTNAIASDLNAVSDIEVILTKLE